MRITRKRKGEDDIKILNVECWNADSLARQQTSATAPPTDRPPTETRGDATGRHRHH